MSFCLCGRKKVTYNKSSSEYKPEEDNVDMCHRKITINDKHVKEIKERSGWLGVCYWKCCYFSGVALEGPVCAHMLTESSCSCCFNTLRQVPNCSLGASFLSLLIPLSLFLWAGSCAVSLASTLVWDSCILR